MRFLNTNTDVALSILNAELAMPNIPTPTMGGEVFWNNLAEADGWKLQQNMFTHHARILNAENVRVAWGTVNAMYKAMDRLVDAGKRYNNSLEEENKKTVTSSNAVQRLKDLKELLDMGAITEDEFKAKKAKLLDEI